MVRRYLELEEKLKAISNLQIEILQDTKIAILKGVKKHAQLESIVNYPTEIEQINHFNFTDDVINVYWVSNTYQPSWDAFCFELPIGVLE